MNQHFSADPLKDLPRGLFYGGGWHEPAGGYYTVLASATQDDLGTAAKADAGDVDACVKAAHAAFPAWRDTPPLARAACLRQLAQKLRTHSEELAWIDAVNGGNPITEMKCDAFNGAASLDYFAGLVLEARGNTLPTGPDSLNYTLRQPFGVVARIVAYNHPLLFLATKMAPALAAGNTVVLKAPDQAPLSAFRLAQLCEDIFPAGVVNFLTGDGVCGKALIEHPLVRRASLVGSTQTGTAILRSAAEKIMPVSLELGGKNPVIICPDANIEKAIEGVVTGMNFTYASQSCGSTSRCFIHRSIYEQVIEKIAALANERHKCGLPTDPETTMGCLISEAQFNKVIGLIDSARSEGARLVCGGGRPDDPALADGWYVEPTIFADVTPRMRLYNEEVFGPVLAIIPWDDDDEVISMANALDYGLTSSVWTSDLARAHRFAYELEAGYVWVNKTSAHIPGAEFGGFKRSGIGREGGFEELLSFTESKNVHVVLNP